MENSNIEHSTRDQRGNFPNDFGFSNSKCQRGIKVQKGAKNNVSFSLSDFDFDPSLFDSDIGIDRQGPNHLQNEFVMLVDDIDDADDVVNAQYGVFGTR
jgi:hypothetical protein